MTSGSAGLELVIRCGIRCSNSLSNSIVKATRAKKAAQRLGVAQAAARYPAAWQFSRGISFEILRTANLTPERATAFAKPRRRKLLRKRFAFSEPGCFDALHVARNCFSFLGELAQNFAGIFEAILR